LEKDDKKDIDKIKRYKYFTDNTSITDRYQIITPKAIFPSVISQMLSLEFGEHPDSARRKGRAR
jgi:hypothetical protein